MEQFKVDDLIIDSINVVDASIDNPDELTIEDHEAEAIVFSIKIDQFLNFEENGVMVKLFVEIKCIDSDENPTGVKANFTIQFIFNIDKLEKYVDKEGEMYTVDQQLSTSILNIVYSTSRGLIYTRCLGTVMGVVILPVISSQKLIEAANLDKGAMKGEEESKGNSKPSPSKRPKNSAPKKSSASKKGITTRKSSK